MAAGPIDAGEALWQAAGEAHRLPTPSMFVRWASAWERAGREGRVALGLYVLGTIAGLAGLLAMGEGPAWATAASVVAVAIGARAATILVLWLASETARGRITPTAVEGTGGE